MDVSRVTRILHNVEAWPKDQSGRQISMKGGHVRRTHRGDGWQQDCVRPHLGGPTRSDRQRNQAIRSNDAYEHDSTEKIKKKMGGYLQREGEKKEVGARKKKWKGKKKSTKSSRAKRLNITGPVKVRGETQEKERDGRRGRRKKDNSPGEEKRRREVISRGS